MMQSDYEKKLESIIQKQEGEIMVLRDSVRRLEEQLKDLRKVGKEMGKI